jgi:CRP-like cAMP-binding protein
VCGLEPFRDIPRSEAQSVLAEAHQRTVEKGSQIFAQGSAASRIFFLVAGRLKIVQASADGHQILAHWVLPGQFFGLAVAFGREDYPGTALAVVESSALVWPMSAWTRLASEHPNVVAAALRMTGGHLQDAFARLREAAGARVEQRVARALLRLARQSGRRTDDGIEIGFPVTRQDIADMTNATLYTVSRTLSAWQQAGILAGGRRRIEIRDLDRLERLAGEE